MKSYIELLRPHQWLKNLMLLFPPFMGGTLLHFNSFYHLSLPLISFSLCASVVYIVNDIFDLQQDVHHPLKSRRPLAAGKITIAQAITIAVVLLVIAVITALQVSLIFFLILLAYLIISMTYSLVLKTVPIVEMFCVASGFLLRLQAGGSAYHVKISDWLFLSVFLLALFLVSGKRLGELRHGGGISPGQIRPVLVKYPDRFFEACLYMSGSAVLVTYTLYIIKQHGNILIIPVCCFGLLSYMFRVLDGKGGDPTRALLKDPSLFIVGFIWTVLVGIDTYL